MQKFRYGPENPDITYVPHKYEEHLFDTGEITLNYATTGPKNKPAIVLIPAQTESWWGYESAMGMLSKYFQVFAVDLRGQGRSSRTPGRYTYDNMGNDLVKLITFVVTRPVIVAGLSSGGVLAAWLSAYAPPGMVRGAYFEDPALFISELTPIFGPSVRQVSVGILFESLNKYLGDQWSIGDWDGLVKALPMAFHAIDPGATAGPPQNLKEYDPEWGKATVNGTLSASCDHSRMLSHVRCPILFTHHSTLLSIITGSSKKAVINDMMEQIEKLIKDAGQPFTYLSFPKIGHFMHSQDPEQYVRTILDWAKTLPTEAEIRKKGVFAVNKQIT
jgi:pimeloyl-ACP methyl ester carboxylesterase